MHRQKLVRTVRNSGPYTSKGLLMLAGPWITSGRSAIADPTLRMLAVPWITSGRSAIADPTLFLIAVGREHFTGRGTDQGCEDHGRG